MNFYSIIRSVSILVHTVLGLYVILKASRHRLNQAFSLAVFSTAAMEFGYLMLLVSSGHAIWVRIALIGQCLTSANIVLLSLVYGRENYTDSLRTAKLYLVAAYSVFLIFLIITLSGVLNVEFSDTPSDYGLRFSRTGLSLIVFLFICTLLSLINLENTYRQASQSGRRIRYPAIAFIGMLSFHLLIYSWTLGFSYLRMDVLTVASITLIIANMCIAYPVIRPQPRDSRIYVARAVIAKSYTLLLAGIYLLIIGMLGKIIQMIGKNLNFFLAFLIAFLVLFALIIIILSKSLKRRFQTFIERNFYRNRYDYRKEWENFSRRVFSASVGTGMRALLQEVLGAVSETIGPDSASIMLLDERRNEFSMLDEDREYQPSEAIPAQDEFLGWLWRYGRPVRIDRGQCQAGGTSSAPPDIPGVLISALESSTQDAVSGILLPVVAEHTLMAIVILGQRETSSYSQEDLDLLETMANQIAIAIMNARTSQELALSRELESFHRLSTMLLHDLKSSASMLSLVVQNAADNFDNPEFQRDALSTMSNVVDRIQKLILKLSTAPQKMELSSTLQSLDLAEIASSAVARSGIRNLARIEVTEEIDPVPRLMLDPENMERVILNLILNAVEAIEDKGTVEIRTCQTPDGYAQVSVSDTGCGMSQEFIRNSLFRSFQTTKEKGLGIGLYQCQTIIEACGGVIDVESRQGIGSTFMVKLPIPNMHDGIQSESHHSINITGGREVDS